MNNQQVKFPVPEEEYVPLQSKAFKQFMSALESTPLLAHHPSCKHHRNHLIWIGKIPICLGCAMLSIGLIVGIFMIPYLTFFQRFPFSVLLSLGVLLYLPAIGQVWIQNKTYKLLSRTSLGISIVLMLYAGLWLTPKSAVGIVIKCAFLGIFWVVWNLTLQVRKQYSVSPCKNCPDGKFPICAYTIPRINSLANQYFKLSNGKDPVADEFVRALQHETDC